MKRTLVILSCAILSPVIAVAQTGLVGVVRDTTGAVLPGVTVEASSPALIEKVRTGVTDDQGVYRIVDLRPGVYAITFSLAGFSTVKREGIELTTNFTATVNAELRVGAIEETVTVSGQSPVVDVQNIVQQRVIPAEVIDALPSGRGVGGLAVLIPGMSIRSPSGTYGASTDLAGLGGLRQSMAIHGGRTGDCTMNLDGLPYNVPLTGGCTTVFAQDTGQAEEFSYEIGAITVEQATGGVRTNVIPKEGGNLFKGSFFGNYGNGALQNDNLTPELRARGLRSVNRLKRMWDVNPSFGGPIKQDKLWFFGSFRHWSSMSYVAGGYFETDPRDFVYTPDLSRQAFSEEWIRSEGVRLTWQATQKNKLGLYLVRQAREEPFIFVTALRTPEASNHQNSPTRIVQGSWSSPRTNRLLFEARAAWVSNRTRPWYQAGVTPDMMSVRELSTNRLFRATDTFWWERMPVRAYRAAVSYVTGSHAFKTGFTLDSAYRRRHTEVNGDMNLQFLNGVPRSVVVHATPLDQQENLNAALGLYVKDQWTMKRLTLNVGIRFDYLNGSVPEQHWPAVRLVGPRDFAEVRDVPKWTDLSPRLGVAYDLFGTGKTALKVTLSRYLEGQMLTFAETNNPIRTSVTTATRTWDDRNGDFFPQEEELGPLSNPSFGQVVIRTRNDEALREGFGKRGYNWETSAGVQHELLQGVALDATYFRRSYGNFTVTDNLVTGPSDYDPFCIRAPVDARLPGGGGNQICGLYDVNPVKFRQAPNNLVTFADNYGKQTEVYNGVDFTINTRLPRGAVVQGGLNIGRVETDNCALLPLVPESVSTQPLTSASFGIVSWPQQLLCHIKPPLQSVVKFLGTVGLPWDIQAAATFQSLPGPPIQATYVATSSEIRTSLGRDLSAGPTGTSFVELIEPGTLFEKRLYQVDIRLAKIVRMGRFHVKGMLDLYNLLNAGSILALNTRYGPAWLTPTFILPGRLMKLGAQVDF